MKRYSQNFTQSYKIARERKFWKAFRRYEIFTKDRKNLLLTEKIKFSKWSDRGIVRYS